MIKVLLLTAVILICGFDNGYAEVYRYMDDNGVLHMTDNLGSIPEKYREGGGNEISPASAPVGTTQNRLANSPQPNGQSLLPAAGQNVKEKPLTAPPLPLVAANQNVVTINTDMQQGNASEGNVVLDALQYGLNEKFKDVEDPSQLPAFNTDTTIDCTKYKEQLDADLTTLENFMNDTTERKERGESDVLLKMRALLGTRHLVNFIYDIAFTPKHCTEEFEKENKDRMER